MWNCRVMLEGTSFWRSLVQNLVERKEGQVQSRTRFSGHGPGKFWVFPMIFLPPLFQCCSALTGKNFSLSFQCVPPEGVWYCLFLQTRPDSWRWAEQTQPPQTLVCCALRPLGHFSGLPLSLPKFDTCTGGNPKQHLWDLRKAQCKALKNDNFYLFLMLLLMWPSTKWAFTASRACS